MPTQNDIAKHFRSLHQPGNPPNSNKRLRCRNCLHNRLTANSTRDRNSVLRDRRNDRPAIAASVRAINPTKPLTVDVQDGHGDASELADTIKQVIELGAVGCNLEDMDATGVLRSVEEATARVGVAVQAAREAGVPDFVVNARTDVLLTENGTIEEAIERGRAFLEAGATTVFVWGGPSGRGVSSAEVTKLVDALGGYG
ncbi:Pyruvate/Phosphoenolpyruvate kinase [Penicillium expansum]|nr:Pyruvate/Phosphoenolpyruvate kinase [Penicillium expansum]